MKQSTVRSLVLCLLLLLPFAFFSCENSEEKKLLGRWETQGKDEELGTFSMVYHFAEDGEIFIEQKQGDAIPFSIPFGTWTATKNRVTIESDGEKNDFTFSVKENELILSREGEENLIFHRIGE